MAHKIKLAPLHLLSFLIQRSQDLNTLHIDFASVFPQGEIQLGVVTQSEYAFMHVLNDVSLVVFQVINRMPHHTLLALFSSSALKPDCVISVLILNLEASSLFQMMLNLD